MTAEETLEEHIVFDGSTLPRNYIGNITNAMKVYAREKCREQRNLCANNTKGHGHEIKNAPEPIFD